jgi:hypothetical protein
MSTGLDYLAQDCYIESHSQKPFQNRILSVMTDCQDTPELHLPQRCSYWYKALTWNNVTDLHFEGPHIAKNNPKIPH